MSKVKTNTIATRAGQQYNGGVASANYTGVGLVTVVGSTNVSSIADLAVGSFFVNFSMVAPSSGYATVAAHSYNATATGFGYNGAVSTSTGGARLGCSTDPTYAAVMCAG